MTPPPVPEYEEWRLAFDVPKGGPKASDLAEDLGDRLPRSVDVHRKSHRGIRVYAGTRAKIDHAFEVIGSRLVAHRVQAEILLSRWNPGGERWQAPSLPITPPQTPLLDPRAELDELAWEVRLRFEHGPEADRLLDDLCEKGAAVLGGWKRCLVAVPDEATARQQANELRLAAPRAEIEVRPLSRFRRWMIRQRVVGNYVGPYDAYDGGAGSGG